MTVRPRRHVLVSALTAVLACIAATVALGGQAGAAGSGYTRTPILVDVITGTDNHPCRISGDLYVPDGVSATRRAPAVLATNGFGGDKRDSGTAGIGRAFAQEGYVVLTYSGLGFGSSTCKISLDDPAVDGRAGRQLVDVLAGSKDYRVDGDAAGTPRRLHLVSQEAPGDPRVGMVGGSYGGQIQFAIASQDRRLDALIPLITWNDLAYSLAPNNTSLTRGVSYRTPGVAKKEWIDLFTAAGIASGVQNVAVAGDPETLGGCPNFIDEACPAMAQLNTAGYPDASTLALARRVSVASYMSRIHTPTLLVQGQKDTLFNLQEAVASYRALQTQGTPVKMVWQSWGHSQGGTPAAGELSFDAPLRQTFLGRRFLHWMDHYVRGTSAPTGPEFAYFRDWVRYDHSPSQAGTAIARAYLGNRRFRQPITHRLFASGSDRLVPSRSRVRPGSASYANPGPAATSYSETSGLEGSQVNNPPYDQPGTFAAFTSPRLTRRAVLVGSPRLTLRLDAPVAAATQSAGPSGKLILFAKLYDIRPDGSKKLQHRLISPVRVTDVTRPVRVQLPGVVQRFARGHRMQLVVAASDMAYANNTVSQPVTITTSPERPTSLGLPLRSSLRF